MAKKIGLALSGGGTRGFAHVGVLKVLAENSIKIDMIAGTSAGAIVGAAFASGMTASELVDMSAKIGWLNMVRPGFSFRGLLSSAPMGKFLAAHYKVRRIEETPISFSAVAYDLGTGERAVLQRGDLVTAVRASGAVPGIFSPVRDETGRRLVDGGVLSPMPVDVARSNGADIVIAADVLSCGATFRENSRNAVSITLQSSLSLLQALSKMEHAAADVVIEPQVTHLRFDAINKRDEFIRLGIEAARAQIDEIKRLTSE